MADNLSVVMIGDYLMVTEVVQFSLVQCVLLHCSSILIVSSESVLRWSGIIWDTCGALLFNSGCIVGKCVVLVKNYMG